MGSYNYVINTYHYAYRVIGSTVLVRPLWCVTLAIGGPARSPIFKLVRDLDGKHCTLIHTWNPARGFRDMAQTNIVDI
jgi:hypothetical protein